MYVADLTVVAAIAENKAAYVGRPLGGGAYRVAHSDLVCYLKFPPFNTPTVVPPLILPTYEKNSNRTSMSRKAAAWFAVIHMLVNEPEPARSQS